MNPLKNLAKSDTFSIVWMTDKTFTSVTRKQIKKWEHCFLKQIVAEAYIYASCYKYFQKNSYNWAVYVELLKQDVQLLRQQHSSLFFMILIIVGRTDFHQDNT